MYLCCYNAPDPQASCQNARQTPQSWKMFWAKEPPTVWKYSRGMLKLWMKLQMHIRPSTAPFIQCRARVRPYSMSSCLPSKLISYLTGMSRHNLTLKRTISSRPTCMDWPNASNNSPIWLQQSSEVMCTTRMDTLVQGGIWTSPRRGWSKLSRVVWNQSNS